MGTQQKITKQNKENNAIKTAEAKTIIYFKTLVFSFSLKT